MTVTRDVFFCNVGAMHIPKRPCYSLGGVSFWCIHVHLLFISPLPCLPHWVYIYINLVKELSRVYIYIEPIKELIE